MLGNLIGGFIVILVGVTLVPTVATQVSGATGNANLYLISSSFFMGLIVGVLGFYTDPIKRIIDLIFLLLVLGISTLISFISYFQLRRLGK